MTFTIPVDRERLWQSHVDIARIGALPGGGCCRMALSAEDKTARDLFVAWCRAAGCAIAYDQVGNIYARRPGTDPSRAAVATGSHLDTQPHAGKYDGIYGVLAGLEVVRALNDAKIRTVAPIEVIVWTNEEGVRFGPPLAGSSAFAGAVAVSEIHAARTLDGTSVHDDLEAIGYLGKEVPGSRRYDCFVEAHIEQGPILEAERRTIGVVTKVQGIRWTTVTVTGRDSHAGTTPMNCRRNALLGAAEMIVEIDRIARCMDDSARLTVGKILVEPNSGATIPGMTSFNVDLRHPDASTLEELDQRMQAAMTRIGQSQGLQIEFRRTIDKSPVVFAADVVEMVRRAARDCGYSSMDMLSGAGHDAMNVAKKVPSAMIFVPCKDGLSHNEAESATPSDLAAGAQTLLNVLLARAGTGIP